MSTLKKLVPANVEPITDVLDILKSDTLKDMDALDISAMLKRAETYLATIRENMVPAANKVFVAKYSTTEKQLVLIGGKALVSKYTPKSTWEYPVAVVNLEAELRAKQKAAQASGTAKKQLGTINADISAVFSLNIVEKFR